jgi:BON domain
VIPCETIPHKEYSMREEEITDRRLQRDIREELGRDLAGDAEDVVVKVDRGIAILAGLLSGMSRRRTAEVAAGRVRDVKAVIDEIEVRPETSESDDIAVARSALSALDGCPGLGRDHLRLFVSDGKVRVEGIASREGEKQAIGTALRSRLDARAVDDEMVVEASALPRDDTTIPEQAPGPSIRRACGWEANMNPSI